MEKTNQELMHENERLRTELIKRKKPEHPVIAKESKEVKLAKGKPIKPTRPQSIAAAKAQAELSPGK